jgi:hypothetical protein
VVLKFENQSFTQPISILRDPRSPGSDADIESSVKTQIRIRDDISGVADRVNQMEWLRKQIEVIEAMLRPPKKKEKEKPLVPDEEEDFGEPETSEEQTVDEAEAKNKAEMLKIVKAMNQKIPGAVTLPAVRTSLPPIRSWIHFTRWRPKSPVRFLTTRSC